MSYLHRHADLPRCLCCSLRMLTLRSYVVGVVAVLLGAAGCSSPSQTTTDTQPLSSFGFTSTSADVAATRVRAEQGYAAAQYYLGFMYANGHGVPQDDAQAVSWYRKAAEQGDVGAQYLLGNAYYSGTGLPQDYVQSHKWRNLAASRAFAESQKTYAEARDSLAKSMTPAQIAEAQKLAREWLNAFEQRGGT
jgi:TPR repeat protein